MARRYAGALFAVALNASRLDQVVGDLQSVAEAVHSSPPFAQVIRDPVMPQPRKQQLIERVLQGKVDDISLAFIRLLVEKRREEIIPDVAEELLALRDEYNHTLRVEARVAAPLRDDERQSLIQSLEHQTGYRIEFSVQIDPNVLGGVWLRMGDTVIDGSVRGNLERMRALLWSDTEGR